MDTLAEVEPIYETLPGWREHLGVPAFESCRRKRSST
jgi:adenylosuccinate synthase